MKINEDYKKIQILAAARIEKSIQKASKIEKKHMSKPNLYDSTWVRARLVTTNQTENDERLSVSPRPEMTQYIDNLHVVVNGQSRAFTPVLLRNTPVLA